MSFPSYELNEEQLSAVMRQNWPVEVKSTTIAVFSLLGYGFDPIFISGLSEADTEELLRRKQLIEQTIESGIVEGLSLAALVRNRS